MMERRNAILRDARSEGKQTVRFFASPLCGMERQEKETTRSGGFCILRAPTGDTQGRRKEAFSNTRSPTSTRTFR
jgi:hypothetical protein